MTDLFATGFPMTITRPQLVTLLGEKYPDYKWEKIFLLRGRFAQQNRLERAVVSIFPVMRPTTTYLFA